MSRYRVIHAFHGVPAGEVIEARLDAAKERRVLDRGQLELLERSDPAIQPGSITLPDGWPTKHEQEGE